MQGDKKFYYGSMRYMICCWLKSGHSEEYIDGEISN